MSALNEPTTIAAVRVRSLDIPLLAPFGISRGALEAASNVLLAVELADGTVGHGEAAPFPAYNGETQAGALQSLRRAASWLPGCDGQDWRSVGLRFRKESGPASGSALCALETALLDAAARRDGAPLWQRFGGQGTELETDMTVTTGTPSEAGEAARRIRLRGIRIIKAKVGGPGGPDADLARLAAIHEEAPEAPLILDGNAGISRADARALADGLKARGIMPTLLEQWLAKDDLEGMAALGAETGWVVAADESVATAADARAVVRAGAAQVFNIKLMKAGVAEALDIIGVAKAAGVRLMIGGNVESILGMTMSACFAAGLGGFGFADLDTPLFLAENPFEGGYHLDGGRLSVAHIKAGHGVHPRRLLL